MKTLTLIMLATLMSLTSAQMFDYTWPDSQPTIYTMDILEQPTVPGFLNDYSAPGQVLWNQQVNWQLNQLEDLQEDLFEIPVLYYPEEVDYNPLEIEYPVYSPQVKDSPYWFQTEEYKKKLPYNF
jgi:hypothetical protein